MSERGQAFWEQLFFTALVYAFSLTGDFGGPIGAIFVTWSIFYAAHSIEFGGIRAPPAQSILKVYIFNILGALAILPFDLSVILSNPLLIKTPVGVVTIFINLLEFFLITRIHHMGNVEYLKSEKSETAPLVEKAAPVEPRAFHAPIILLGLGASPLGAEISKRFNDFVAGLGVSDPQIAAVIAMAIIFGMVFYRNASAGHGVKTNVPVKISPEERAIIDSIFKALGVPSANGRLPAESKRQDVGPFAVYEFDTTGLNDYSIKTAFNIAVPESIDGQLQVLFHNDMPAFLCLIRKGRMPCIIDLIIYRRSINLEERLDLNEALDRIFNDNLEEIEGKAYVYLAINSLGGILIEPIRPDVSKYSRPEDVRIFTIPVLPGVFAPLHPSSAICAKAAMAYTNPKMNRIKPKMKVLEMRSGTGIASSIAALNGCSVDAVDIKEMAAQNTMLTASIMNTTGNVNARVNNLLEGLGQYDLIIFNMPHHDPYRKIKGEPLPDLSNVYDRSDIIMRRIVSEIASHLTPGGKAVLVNSEAFRIGESGKFYDIEEYLRAKTGCEVAEASALRTNVEGSVAYVISKPVESAARKAENGYENIVEGLVEYDQPRAQAIIIKAWQAREKAERLAIAVRRLQHSLTTDVVAMLYPETEYNIVVLRDKIGKLWNEVTNIAIDYKRLPVIGESDRWLAELSAINKEAKILGRRHAKHLAHAKKMHMTGEAIKTLEVSLGRLNQTIAILENSIKFAKSEVEIKKGKPVDIAMLIRDVCARVIKDAGPARAGVITMDLPNEPLRVTGDKLELLNMVSSVVENAVNSAMGRDLENAKVMIRLRQAGRYMEIVVEDNGSGINNELMKAGLISYRGNLNRRFAFQDLDISTNGPGGGVGTTDAWYVALDHNGEIDLATETEGNQRGTAVTIRLPLRGKNVPDITKDRGFAIGIPENISEVQEKAIRQALGDKAEIIKVKDVKAFTIALRDKGLRIKGLFIDSAALQNKITSEDIIAAMLATTYEGIVSMQDIDNQTRLAIAELIKELLPEIKNMGAAEIFAFIQEKLRADPEFAGNLAGNRDKLRNLTKKHIGALSAFAIYNDPSIINTALPVTRNASVIITEEGALNNPTFAKGIEDVLNAKGNVSFLYGRDMNEEQSGRFLIESGLTPELASKINLVTKIRPDGTMKKLEEIETEIGYKMPAGFSLDNTAIAIAPSELRQMGSNVARMKVLELKEINISGRSVLLSINTERVAYRIALMDRAPEGMSLDKELPGLYYDSDTKRYTYLLRIVPIDLGEEIEAYRNAMMLLSSAA